MEPEGIDECARCGAPVTADSRWIHSGSQYDYCEDCGEVFDNVIEDGVTVRSRHGNQEFHHYPYEAPKINGDTPENQVEALAAGLKQMREKDVQGVFIYQKTGSYWLISEYLDAHSSIATDVEEYLESRSRLNSLVRRLPF